MKYKKKYIDYKKKLYTNKNIIGGGTYGQITLYYFYPHAEIPQDIDELKQFIQKGYSVNIDSYPDLLVLYELMSNNSFIYYIKLETFCDNLRCEIFYRIVSMVGSGATSFAFRIKQIIPPLPDVNNNFVIKFNRKKGDRIDNLSVLPRIKALYQGEKIIDFAIFNFLGEGLKKFLSISPIEQLSLIRQLHQQLFDMNTYYMGGQFHNDVKQENVVVIESNPSNPSKPRFQLSLIDYGIASHKESYIGTTYSMCMRSCLKYCLYIHTDKKNKDQFTSFNIKLISSLITNMNLIISALENVGFMGTDYVGFFNVVIYLISDTDTLAVIYRKLLDIQNDFSFMDNLKILCLLCYISLPLEQEYSKLQKLIILLLDHELCKPIVDNIRQKLSLYYDKHKDLFASFIPPMPTAPTAPTAHPTSFTLSNSNLIQFLCAVYEHIHENCIEKDKFVHVTKLPKLLWKLGSTCLQPLFRIGIFNRDYDTIFTPELHQPLTTLPTTQLSITPPPPITTPPITTPPITTPPITTSPPITSPPIITPPITTPPPITPPPPITTSAQ